MSHYQADNKDAVSHVAPLFASSWMALYYLLRENYNERRTTVELDKPVSLINDEIAEITRVD